MAFQLWLAQVLRDAGLTVVEVDGWQTRTVRRDPDATGFDPIGVAAHETRGTPTSTPASELRTLINGRAARPGVPALPGPISQLFLARPTGVWYVVAAGQCNHVRDGLAGRFAGHGNPELIGVEAQHATGEDWADKPAQYESYVRGVAAICRRQGWTADRVVGHREHQPGQKTDPEFDMHRFRSDVAAEIIRQDHEEKEVDDMRPYVLIRHHQHPHVFAVWGPDAVRWLGPAEYAALKESGVPVKVTKADDEAARLAADADVTPWPPVAPPAA